MKKHLRKIIGTGIGGLLVLGTINAIIINHHSEIGGEVLYIRGLDEMDGLTHPGRVLATSRRLEKIEIQEEAAPEVSEAPAVRPQEEAPSAIAEDLQLELVEVINPKIWSKGLASTEFFGELLTANGSIESLIVNLPGKEEISISFAEMNGNVFQYDYAGEVYTGMLYQVDPKSYMVTLTNGPLEGTRMRFVDDFTPEQVAIKDALKEEHNLDVGYFGDNAPQATKKQSPAAEPALVEAQMVNFGTQV